MKLNATGSKQSVRSLLGIQTLLMLLFMQFSWAKNGAAQEMLNQRISISVENERIESVISKLEKSANVRFLYSREIIKSQRKISFEAENKPLSAVLESILQPLGLKYEVSGDKIVLKRQPHTSEAQIGEATAPEATQANADINVSGTVTDNTGTGLPGVSILVKGTQTGTTTDAEGKYKLSVADGSSVMIFSFVGYVSQEIAVGGKSTIDVQLLSDDRALEEVVVVGYGTQKKANLTGAVSTIDSKVIENRPSSNLATGMQGVTPGLVVTRQTGQPGRENVNIQIRGATSANGNVNPLVLLDGVSVPISTMQTMNPNDVESISVLKDAAAAAIYGAQAAGGVILITTKKGKSGKVTFDYLGQQGIDWSLNVPDRMSLMDEALFSNLARLNSGSSPEYSDEEMQRIRDRVPYAINPADTSSYLYYNQDPIANQILRKYTSMSTHNITARGGTEKLNFLISGGYYNKQGVFKVGPDNYNRYNVRMNLGSQLTKHLTLDSRLAYTNDKARTASAEVNGGGLIYQVYRFRTRNPFFTPEGRYNTANNTYAILESGGYNENRRNYFDGVFTLTAANFVKGLQIRAIAGTQYRRGDRQQFNRTVPLWSKSKVASYVNQINGYTVTNDVTKNTNLQALVNYDFAVGKDHNFGLFAGYQWEDFRTDTLSTGATNLVSNDLPTLNLGDDKTKSNRQIIATYAFQSVFGRFNYNYKNKYLLEATIRLDESSKLAPGLRRKVFPAASVGWNVHQEDWFASPLPFFSEFKLRGSWGRLGGALGTNIGYYDYLSQLSRGNNLVLGDSRTSYISQGSIPSAALSWETIETTNGGIDIGLLQNRLQFSGDYYVKYNRNMLTPQQLPGVIGVGTPRKNNGELKSWGWETELRFRDKIGKDFNYSVAINFSDNNNKLINFSGRTVVSAGTNGLIEGYALNTVWGYQTNGYFNNADEVKQWAFQDNRAGAGDVKYVDLNGDKRLSVGKGTVADHGDLVLLGTTAPRYLFGVNLGASWKGFDFTAFFQGVGKRSYRSTPESIAPLLVTWKQAMGIHSDYWTPENTDALFPRPYTGATHNYVASDKWTLDASYIRLKNIQFGYTVPSRITERIKVSRARIFFSGQDILTFSGLGKFQGYFDPETRDGVENDYPFFATASVGINVSF
ncbi:SusC/RagA family TonB-linked outer membrane protein [Dyadobacter endophyticus]|uniref:SusC/RagA family TonB-linked outer membrane protein n=1 Tax=Dyadobacter endophyticus TaxID=1749036 RepID=A0ABQ1YF06_9BACT|nr:TonB-dependent receptor [Dyadobacter endophyticus]GGH22197.1 SusC/RagA family TonB-linked outer membrane protein [Dyadobacter endophyticus]